MCIFFIVEKKCLILQQQNKQKQMENVNLHVHFHTNLLLLFVRFLLQLTTSGFETFQRLKIKKSNYLFNTNFYSSTEKLSWKTFTFYITKKNSDHLILGSLNILYTINVFVHCKKILKYCVDVKAAMRIVSIDMATINLHFYFFANIQCIARHLSL